MSRYVLALPLGQTASVLLSQQSLAQWRTESCPGASGWRSEERERGKAGMKNNRTDRRDWHNRSNRSILLVFLYSTHIVKPFPALGVCSMLVLLLLVIT